MADSSRAIGDNGRERLPSNSSRQRGKTVLEARQHRTGPFSL